MKIASIQFPVFNPYGKPAIEIYLSGCTRNCLGCHNPELADFNIGENIDMDMLKTYLEQRKDLFDIISITGGDLLCQNLQDAFKLVFMLYSNFSTKRIWVFTGEDNWFNIPSWLPIMVDVIKYGSYKASLKQDGFPSSSNQKIYTKTLDKT